MSESSSFIPRQNTQARSRKVVRKRIYIFSYLTYIFFFGTLLVVGVLFFWQLRLEGALAAQQTALSEERNAFSQSDIAQIKELDGRLLLLESLLDTQPSMYAVIESLKETTLENIQLTTFKIVKEAATNDYAVEFSGVAPDFSALLYQREVTNNNRLLGDTELLTITYGADSDSEQSDQSAEASSFESPITFSMKAVLPVSEIVANTTSSLTQPEQRTATETAEESAEATTEPVVDEAPIDDTEAAADLDEATIFEDDPFVDTNDTQN